MVRRDYASYVETPASVRAQSPEEIRPESRKWPKLVAGALVALVLLWQGSGKPLFTGAAAAIAYFGVHILTTILSSRRKQQKAQEQEDLERASAAIRGSRPSFATTAPGSTRYCAPSEDSLAQWAWRKLRGHVSHLGDESERLSLYLRSHSNLSTASRIKNSNS